MPMGSPLPGSLCDASGANTPDVFCFGDSASKSLIAWVCRGFFLGEEAWEVPAEKALLAGPPGWDEWLGLSAGRGL